MDGIKKPRIQDQLKEEAAFATVIETHNKEIKRLIEFGKARGYLRDVDSDIMSYSIWCFIRGFNADALGRKLPVAQAAAAFKYSFGILLDGLRPVPDAP